MPQHESRMSTRYAQPENLRARARHAADDARNYVGENYQHAQEMVTQHPGASALVVFGVGLGVGMMIGCSLAHSARDRQRAYLVDRRQAERFGRHMFDSLAHYLPERISKMAG